MSETTTPESEFPTSSASQLIPEPEPETHTPVDPKIDPEVDSGTEIAPVKEPDVPQEPLKEPDPEPDVEPQPEPDPEPLPNEALAAEPEPIPEAKAAVVAKPAPPAPLVPEPETEAEPEESFADIFSEFQRTHSRRDGSSQIRGTVVALTADSVLSSISATSPHPCRSPRLMPQPEEPGQAGRHAAESRSRDVMKTDTTSLSLFKTGNPQGLEQPGASLRRQVDHRRHRDRRGQRRPACRRRHSRLSACLAQRCARRGGDGETDWRGDSRPHHQARCAGRRCRRRPPRGHRRRSARDQENPPPCRN